MASSVLISAVALVASFVAMASTNSTTFHVCDKTPAQHPYISQSDKPSQEDQLKKLPQYRKNNCSELLQTSKFPSSAKISGKGLVNTVAECYNKHHNLVLRPDDIWAAIMTQFSFYINKNAKKFRGKFVNFEGKKTLTASVGGNLRNAPYDFLVKAMSLEIDRNLVDPGVKKWILPSFSTTTDTDLVTVGVVFMASMKEYFEYKYTFFCGIPSITLEGTIEDWKDIHGRLEKLKEYELQKWYDMLEPILQKFVDAKDGKVDLEFWKKICHMESRFCGTDYVTGWITAFAVFNKDGNWQTGDETGLASPSKKDGSIKEWLSLSSEDIPAGIVEVDVKVDDNGKLYNTVMFAGHMAYEIKEDGCTVQPTLGWAIALKSEDNKN